MTPIVACPYRDGSDARALVELLLGRWADERVNPWPSLRKLRAHWQVVATGAGMQLAAVLGLADYAARCSSTSCPRCRLLNSTATPTMRVAR
jgi:hypothetical protein